MLVNFNLEGLEEKDVREIKYLLQTINDTLEGGIWHTNIKEGAITATQLKIGMQNWSHDIDFSSTDSNTVSWTAGTITMANGTTYSIVAGNTGNMTARTYIYLDIAISTTVLKITTTAGTATGNGKLLLASSVNSTSKALFQVYGGAGGVYIAGGNIEAGSITATQLTGTNLSALYADLGTITAGNITLDTSGFLRTSGKDNYADTTAGIFLGYDTDAYKLHIGDATHYIKWDGTKLIIGSSLGINNLAFGGGALNSLTTGHSNTALGYQALYSNTTGIANTAIGYQALYSNTTYHYNTAIGYQALYSNTTGYDNTAIGLEALYDNTTGISNIAIGEYALENNTTGDDNIAIGYQAGHLTTTGNGNTFIGTQAGRNETGSDKLYIDNSNTVTPLIYGEFDNDLITIYGNLGIGIKTFGTSATRTLAMLNGTVPSTSPANAIQLYAEDVAASSELKVRDEATNVTTLSPHNFELFKSDKNDPFPWSYHSINQLIGKKVNADISGALRELEQISGKKFLYYEDVNKISLDEYMEDKKEQLIANYIAENGTEEEVEKDEAWGEVEVEVQDMKEITGYDKKYEFDEKTGKIKEIKKPKYGKKTVLKNKLKKGYIFNEETGKFLKKIKPTEEEAEKEIKKELVIPKWIEDRL